MKYKYGDKIIVKVDYQGMPLDDYDDDDDASTAEVTFFASDEDMAIVSYARGWVFTENSWEYYGSIPETRAAIGQLARRIPVKNIVGSTVTVAVKISAGERCIHCDNFYPMAEKNHKDGLVCWSCRHDYSWKYKEGMLKV